MGCAVVESGVPPVEGRLPGPLDVDVRHVHGDVHACLEDRECVPAGNRPPHDVILDNVHGVL